MNEQVNNLRISGLAKIANAEDLTSLNDVRVELLGKKGPLSALMAMMGKLDPSEKAAFGKEVNELKNLLLASYESKKVELEEKALSLRLMSEKIDISLPGDKFTAGGKHPINYLVDEICDICIGLGFKVAEGPEVETDHFNFEMLNLPKDHPARDMQDTFYIDETNLLRTHTSPVQARTLLECQGQGPVRIICPGRVYRRDEDDATHSHQFNQIEGLVIDKNVTMADLKGTLSTIVKRMFGNKRVIRFRSSFFPFTEPSVEVDVSCASCDGKGCNICKGSGWIEILGAGMVHPNVLKMANFDETVYQGFAFGIGIDRIAMLRYGITDIRHLYNNDLKVLKQFAKER